MVGAAVLWAAVTVGVSAAQDVINIERRLPDRADLSLDAPDAPSQVETEHSSDTASGADFVLAAVSIDGATVFGPDDFAPLYEPYLAAPVTPDDMAGIAQAVTQLYRDAGYVLSRAVAPAQTGAGGVLKLRVHEGYVDRLEISGAARDAVRARLQPILDERPLRVATLDRALALAGDLAGVSIDSSRLVPDIDDFARHTLVVESSLDTFDAWAFLDNRGGGSAGELQAYATASFHSTIAWGDRLTAGVFTAPQHPDRLAFGELGYDLPVGHGGTVVSAYGSVSEADEIYALPVSVTATTKAAHARVTIAHPFIRSRTLTLRGDAGVATRTLRQKFGGVTTFDDELWIAEAGVSLLARAWGGDVFFDADAAFGWADANGAPSRFDAKEEYSRLRFYAYRYQDLSTTFGVFAAVSGQAASGALLAGEEFTLGGAQFGRAYDYAEVSGDEALAASLELRHGRRVDAGVLDYYRVYAFYDVGSVWNLGADLPMDHASVASAGLGALFTIAEDVNLTFELAKPLTKTPAAESSKDLRGFFSLASSF